MSVPVVRHPIRLNNLFELAIPKRTFDGLPLLQSQLTGGPLRRLPGASGTDMADSLQLLPIRPGLPSRRPMSAIGSSSFWRFYAFLDF
jgi:hypothetical protein